MTMQRAELLDIAATRFMEIVDEGIEAYIAIGFTPDEIKQLIDILTAHLKTEYNL